MSQILALGSNRFITIDRSWSDGGKPVRYGLVGGQMVQLTDGQRPKPDILMAGKDFFYKNGLPVTKVEDVSHLDEPFRSQAIAFITKGSAKPIEVKLSQVEAAEPKRGRGRPKKVEAPKGPRKIEIKDEASLRAVAGDATLDEYEDN
jgi:hypothetical protein